MSMLLTSGCIWFMFTLIRVNGSGRHEGVTSRYNVDTSRGLGRTFDGIGGISGGVGTSKLLISYAEPYRSQILDYLFKPNFGASLQILKVEIGGDGPGPDGTESSHMHESWDERYDRGYEWWLMVQATKRNPLIKLYGLPWSYPGWVAMGTPNPWTNVSVTADYILRWIQGAKVHYDLDIDYIGLWNERKWDNNYIKVLRRMLDSHGFGHVMIVATDNTGWAISADMKKDPELAAAISVIGCHYPKTNSSSEALETGKALWASEDYSTFNNDIGGECWAKTLNQNYVNGFITSTISWDLIASYYENLPFGGDGLMTAVEPWSGHYVVNSPIWVTAHTTHFTSVGWRYLDHGAGVGHLDLGGSFVSLVDTNTGDYTLVIETMTHDHSKCIGTAMPGYNVKPQNATFQFHGYLDKLEKLYLWRTRLYYDGKPDELFVELKPIQVINGSITVYLDVDAIYTLTTITRDPQKLYPDPPKAQTFSLPYEDDFEVYPLYSESYNFVSLMGVWEIRTSKGKGHGQVNRQVILNQPCYWCLPGDHAYPTYIGGNFQWSSIYIQMDVYIPSVNGSSGVFLAVRVNAHGCGTMSDPAVVFAIYPDSNNFTIATGFQSSKVVYTGRLSSTVKHDTWYHLGLATSTSEAVGFFEMEKIFAWTIPAQPSHGFVGYGATSYGITDYDNLNIQEYNTKTTKKTMYPDSHNDVY